MSHKKIQHQKIKSLAFHSSVTKRHRTKISSVFCGSVPSPVLTIYLLSLLVKSRLSSDTTCKVSAFNDSFQSNQNSTYFEDLRCTRHTHCYKQQPAFEPLSPCLHHFISTQTYKSASVPTYLLQKLAQTKVGI